MRKDWLGVVRNGVEAEGSRWLVRALGLSYHVENLNLMIMEKYEEIEREKKRMETKVFSRGSA
jgi:hypothetical protein